MSAEYTLVVRPAQSASSGWSACLFDARNRMVDSGWTQTMWGARRWARRAARRDKRRRETALREYRVVV